MITSLGFSQGAAPTAPARNAADVISVFCGAYTDVGSDFFPNWGQGTTYEQVALGGDLALHYSNLDYQGVQFNSPINASAMTMLHIDIWTPNVSPFNVYLIAGGENAVTLNPTLSGWNSFDIDLTQYSSAGRTLNNVIQFKFEKPGFAVHAETNSIYLDNIYFWKPANIPALSNFSVATRAFGSGSFSLTAPTSNSTGAITYTSSNSSVATISGSTVTITGVGSTTITATQAAAGGFAAGTISATFEVTPSAAPAPTYGSAGVISVFSDSYTNVAIDTYHTSWSAGDYTPLVISGNNTIKYSNLSYVGLESTTTPINASAMNLFHIDAWTSNLTTFRVKLVDFGADGLYGGGDDSEHELTLSPTLSGWNSYNLFLSDFTNLTGKAHIAQIILSGAPTGGAVYVDNMYFSNQTFTVAPTYTSFTVGSKPLNTADFTITPPASNSAGAFTYTSSNAAIATIVNGNMIHLVGTGFATIHATQAAYGNYLAGSISASIIVTAPLATTPTAAAPTPPTRNAWDVVSVYSGAYADISSTDFFPNWGQGTSYEVVQLAGNNTLHYSNLDYEGINLVPDGSAGINVSTMTKLHLDIWTPNVSPIDVSLIAGGENAIVLTPTLSGWNSFDIDLSQYSGAGRTLNNTIQLKLDKPGFAYHAETNSVYLDNIYFWRPTTALPSPTITNFVVANKFIGDAAFTLTAPTSNSTGAFTYTSSNTAVATISGAVVTIVGAGTTIITANQAASSSYGIGNIAANFVVSFPPPATAAPTPTVPADRVLSLYSDTYTNVAGTDWVPNWGQSTQASEIQISGNNTRKYELMNYQGVQLANPIDLTGMTTLHVDIWTPNCTTFDVYLVNQALPAGQVGFSGEQSVSLSPSQSGWNSFDIPLTSYSTLELNHIQQLKFVATPSGTSTVYLDNIYFTKPTPIVVAPTVTSVVNYCKGTVATPLTADGFTGDALKWYTVATNATTGVNTYTLITTGAPTPVTSTVGSPYKKYAVSQVLSNGIESPKAIITVNVLALPTEVLSAITSNTAGTTAGTYTAATLAVGQYVGTSTTVSYRVPAFADTTLSYYWTVPTGVSIVGQAAGVRTVVQTGANANVLNVNFLNVSSGIGAIGTITVQAQNANGCNTAAKTVALTKVLPAAPAAIAMTDPATTSTTAITSFAAYMGTNKVLKLTATASTTATSYVWELPTGVTQLSGGTSNVITVNFAGVTSSNTFNYSTAVAVPVSTNVLRIGVKSRNGVGDSSTSNTTLANPTTTSTAKLLTLTAVAPAAPASVTLTDSASATPTTAITVISKYVGKNTPLTLTAASSVLASSYEWELPSGVNVVSGNPLTDRIITVNFSGIGQGVTSYYIGVKAKNGIGYSTTINSALIPSTASTAKLLKVTTSLPAVVASVAGQIAGLCGGSTYTYTITAPALTNSYVITAPVGSLVTSASNTSSPTNTLATTDLTFTVTYPAGFVVNTTTTVPNKSLVITSVNGVGSSATTKTVTLATAMAAITAVTGGTTYSTCNQTFSVAAVPGAVSYTWTVPAGASIVSGQTTNSVVVNYGSLTGSQTIKVMATNGCGLSSTVKSVTLTSGACPAGKEEFTTVANDITLYPNPTREEFNVQLNASTAGTMEMTLFNINGAIIGSRTIELIEGNNSINENVSSLAAGVYFVKLTNTSSNETVIKKLVKE